MLNGRVIYLGVLCVFSVISTVFAQSQSATDTIIEKIYQSEIRVREHVDTKVKDVETKISKIDTKVGTLSTDVIENKTNITNMKNDIRDLKGAIDRIWYGILGILGTLIVSIAGYFFKSWRQNRENTDNVGAIDRLTDQITRLITAQTAISETGNVSAHPKVPRLEGLDELRDNIRSTHHDVRERT